jgi:hypothetical protein
MAFGRALVPKEIGDSFNSSEIASQRGIGSEKRPPSNSSSLDLRGGGQGEQEEMTALLQNPGSRLRRKDREVPP